MALRVLSSIRGTLDKGWAHHWSSCQYCVHWWILPFLSSLTESVVLMGLKKAMVDVSPIVRKSAANAIPKIQCIEGKEPLMECLQTLLKDSSPHVLGSVVASFNAICPDRYDLLHKHYHKLCRLLIDADEWGQVALLQLMTRYARIEFHEPVTLKCMRCSIER